MWQTSCVIVTKLGVRLPLLPDTSYQTELQGDNLGYGLEFLAVNYFEALAHGLKELK